MSIVEKLDLDMDKLLTQFISDIDEDQRQLFIDTLERLNWKMNCYINDL